jgi:hypothetical protein
LKPIRERRALLAMNAFNVHKILKKGAEKAKKQADIKLLEIKKAIGVIA